MKKIACLVLLLACTTLAICISCDKESSPSATTKIEYQISPMNDYFTKIAYIDSDENEVVITDPIQFTNGTHAIAITNKPFTAKFNTEIKNTSPAVLSYMLKILVNGKQVKSAAIQVGSGETAPPVSLEFTIPE